MVRVKSLSCGVVLAGAVLALAGLSAAADGKKDDKDKPALTGSWVQQGGELKIEFADKDNLKIVPHGNEEVIVLLCSYTVEKGVVKAKVTGVEGKEEAKEKVKEKLPLGTEFSFKWEVKGDTGALADVKGEKVEILKSHLEGKYEQKK
jgi:hypothetical protein